jgi:hypothetical protein
MARDRKRWKAGTLLLRDDAGVIQFEFTDFGAKRVRGRPLLCPSGRE